MNLKIRSISLGISSTEVPPTEDAQGIEKFFSCANEVCSSANIDIRTKRIFLEPVQLADSTPQDEVRQRINQLARFCQSAGVRWFCIPIRCRDHQSKVLLPFCESVARDIPNAFLNLITVDEDRQIDLTAIRRAAEVILMLSRVEAKGFANFYCGVSLGCAANGAYFPFTFNAGQPGFSIALELVPTVSEVLVRGKDQPIARQSLQ